MSKIGKKKNLQNVEKSRKKNCKIKTPKTDR